MLRFLGFLSLLLTAAVLPAWALRVDDDEESNAVTESTVDTRPFEHGSASERKAQKVLDRLIFIAIFKYTDQDGDGYAQRADIDRLNKNINGPLKGRPLSDEQWNRAAKEIGFEASRGVNLAQFIKSHYGTGSLEEDYRRLGLKSPAIERLLLKTGKTVPTKALANGAETAGDDTAAAAAKRGVVAPAAAEHGAQMQAPVDCEADLDDFQNAWSSEKQAYCCSVKGMGCPTREEGLDRLSKASTGLAELDSAVKKSAERGYGRHVFHAAAAKEEAEKKIKETEKEAGAELAEEMAEMKGSIAHLGKPDDIDMKKRNTAGGQTSTEVTGDKGYKEVADARRLVTEAKEAIRRARMRKDDSGKAGEDDDIEEVFEEDNLEPDSNHGAGSAISVRGLLRPEPAVRETPKEKDDDEEEGPKKKKKCHKQKKVGAMLAGAPSRNWWDWKLW